MTQTNPSPPAYADFQVDHDRVLDDHPYPHSPQTLKLGRRVPGLRREPHPILPCREANAPDFTDPAQKFSAAECCGFCPAMRTCQDIADQIHTAHRLYRRTRGRAGDQWGISGCWAGLWFDQDDADPVPILGESSKNAEAS